MAYNTSPVWKVTFTIRDQKNVSFASFYLKNKVGAALLNVNDPALKTFLDEFASSLQNVTDCHVERYSLSIDYDNDASPVFGAAADVERKAVFQFKTQTGFYTLFTIPGAKYSMFDPSTGETVISNSTVLGDFVDNPLQTHLESIHDKLVNGATVALVTYAVTDRRDDEIVVIRDAYKQHRANQRG